MGKVLPSQRLLKQFEERLVLFITLIRNPPR